MYLCGPHFQLFKQLTHFHEILHGHYAIRSTQSHMFLFPAIGKDNMADTLWAADMRWHRQLRMVVKFRNKYESSFWNFSER
jgi:hypothetical protein